MKKIIIFLFLFSCLFSKGQGVNAFTPRYDFSKYGGVNDSSTDNTTALRALVAAIPAAGGRIYFPAGKGFVFSDSILVNKNIIFEGDGLSSTRISSIVNNPSKGATYLLFTSATKNFFYVKASATNLSPIFEIRDLSIVNTAGSTPTAGAGIKIDGGTLSTSTVMLSRMFRVSVKNFFTDVDYSGNNFTVTDCEIFGPIQYGMVLGNAASPDNGGFIITNTNIVAGTQQPDTAIGIYWKGGGYLQLHHCDFNAELSIVPASNFIYQFYADFSQGSTSDCWIDHCSFENYKYTAIYMFNNSGGAVANIMIDHNEIGPYNTIGTTKYGVYLKGFENVTIDNNTGVNFNTPSPTPYPFMFLDSLTNLVITPGAQIGWTQHDSITRSVNTQKVVMNPILNAGQLEFDPTTSASGKKINIWNASTSSLNASMAFQPTASNASSNIYMVPKGIGDGALSVYGKDIFATPSDYNYINIATVSGGTTFADFNSGAIGTAPVLPIRVYTGTNTSQFIAKIDGNNTMAGSLGLGTVTSPASILDIAKAQNSATSINIANSNTGSGVYTGLQMTSNADVAYVLTLPVTYTTASLQRSLLLEGPTSGKVIIYTSGIAIQANSNKSIQFPFYGVGTNTGTATYDLQVDASGNMIERVASVSGDYTSTLTGSSNVGSVSFQNAHYIRIGNIVHVVIGFQITPTSGATSTTFTASCPPGLTPNASSNVNIGTGTVGDVTHGFNPLIVTGISSSNIAVQFISTTVVSGTQAGSIEFDYTL